MPVPKVLIGLGVAAALLAKESIEQKTEKMKLKRKRRKRK